MLVEEASQCCLVRSHRRPAEASSVVWVRRRGFPSKARLDAEGVFRVADVGNWAVAGIKLDCRDHGRTGRVERTGGVPKHHAHILTQTSPEMENLRAVTLI